MAVYNVNGAEISGGASLPFVSVKNFGALGDGVTDDASAIQSAIDSIKLTGGIVFFPKATYLIKSNLEFYSNQILDFGGSTLLQGAGIDNLLMTHCTSSIGLYNGTHDCLVKNAIFDGGSYEVNNTLVGTVHAKNIIFEGCTFKNAYGSWHNMEINSSMNVKVLDCIFEGSRKTNSNGEMIQIDAYNTSGTWPWGNGLVDGTISKDIEIAGCYFGDNSVSPAIGNHSEVQSQDIRIHDNWFDTLSGTRGAIRITALDVDIYNNTFTGCTVVANSIRRYNANVSTSLESTVHDNRFRDCTSISEGATAYNNMLNGTFMV